MAAWLAAAVNGSGAAMPDSRAVLMSMAFSVHLRPQTVLFASWQNNALWPMP
jgi:hypothetical protein